MVKPDKAQLVFDAVRKGSLPDVKKLMAKKIPASITNSSGQTPLHIASAEGHFLIVQWLTSDKKKADVDARDRDGWTPLHCACHSDHIEIVDHLIARNANVCVETANGSSPMDYFVRMPSQSSRPALFERLFRTMIRKGVNINKQNQSGETPLHMASFRGKDQSVSLLLWNQADPNMKNKYGETPLHLATRAGCITVVKKLIEAKADYTIVGSHGSPYDVAKNSRNPEMAALYESLIGSKVKGTSTGAKPADRGARRTEQKTEPVNTPAPVKTPIAVKAPATKPVTTNPTKPESPVTNPSYASLQPISNPAYASWQPTAAAPSNPGAMPGYMSINNFKPLQPMTNPTGSFGTYSYMSGVPGMTGVQAMQAMQTMQGMQGVPYYVNPSGNSAYLSGGSGQQTQSGAQPTVQPTQPAYISQNPPKQPDVQSTQSSVQPNQPAYISQNPPKQPDSTSPVTTNTKPTQPQSQDGKRNTMTRGNRPSKGETRGRPGSRRGPRPGTKKPEPTTPAPAPVPTPKAEKEIPKNIEQYAIGECIGSGAFGSVYNGFDTHTGAIVAIKQVSLSGIPDDELQNILAELTLLQRLEYKYIVKYIGFVRTKENLNIVLEFIEGGSLSTILKKFGGKTGEPLCARYVAQTLLGLDYLHRRGVVHRDIKSGNILVTKDGTVKLADFGIAAVSDMAQNSEETLATIRNFDMKDQVADTDAVGSPYWMAPEVILMQGASSNSDIWSLGCTVIELVTGDPPYIDLPPMSALFAMVKDDHPPIPSGLSPGLQDFLSLCFKKEPSERPKARELLTHKWILQHVGDMTHELGTKENCAKQVEAPAPISVPTPVIKTPEPIKKKPSPVPVKKEPTPIVQQKKEPVKKEPLPEKKETLPVKKEPTPVPTYTPTPVTTNVSNPTPQNTQQELDTAAKTAAILKSLEQTSAFPGMVAPGPGGNFTEIPTLSNVMENLMGLQSAFASAGIQTPPIVPSGGMMPPGMMTQQGMYLPGGRPILAQPERSEEEEEEEEESEDEEAERERQYNRQVTAIKEYLTWAQQAINAEKGTRAASIRKALRKALVKLHAEFREKQEARELNKEARDKIREIEETFPDYIGIDTDDTDYDSEDSYFLPSDGEDDGDFYF